MSDDEQKKAAGRTTKKAGKSPAGEQLFELRATTSCLSCYGRMPVGSTVVKRAVLSDAVIPVCASAAGACKNDCCLVSGNALKRATRYTSELKALGDSERAAGRKSLNATGVLGRYSEDDAEDAAEKQRQAEKERLEIEAEEARREARLKLNPPPSPRKKSGPRKPYRHPKNPLKNHLPAQKMNAPKQYRVVGLVVETPYQKKRGRRPKTAVIPGYLGRGGTGLFNFPASRLEAVAEALRNYVFRTGIDLVRIAKSPVEGFEENPSKCSIHLVGAGKGVTTTMPPELTKLLMKAVQAKKT